MIIIIIVLVVLLIVMCFISIERIHDLTLVNDNLTNQLNAIKKQSDEKQALLDEKQPLLDELSVLGTMTKINDSEFTLGKITKDEWQRKRIEIIKKLELFEKKIK